MRVLERLGSEAVRMRLGLGATMVASLVLVGGAAIGDGPNNTLSFHNSAGVLRTFSPSGPIDTNSPFFEPLGQKFATTCEHCHFASDAWGVSAEHIQDLFDSTDGQHPIFSAPSANDFNAALALGSGGSDEERRAAYSLLLDKGDALVRRNFAPATPPDFELLAVVDPSLPAAMHNTTLSVPGDPPVQAISGADYFAYTASTNGGIRQFWLHRRPLPTTNMNFVTAAGWDGQDTRQSPNPFVRATRSGMFDVARSTIRGRQTGPSLIAPDGHVYTGTELDILAGKLTEFMFSTFTAQDNSHGAGSLSAKGATGGVYNLSQQPFYFGINDVVEGDLFINGLGQEVLTGRPFTPVIFTLYDAWKQEHNPHRASIARGQDLFNSQRLTVNNVGGLNNSVLTLPDGRTVNGPSGPFLGSCGTCHDSPNVGNHSTRLPINIGIADKSPAFLGRDRVADLPLFYLRKTTTGEVIQTTDPGRAVISGKFAHIGEFKGPVLHGLVPRAPYFHNGMASSLSEVVDFYNARFDGHFTANEKADLVAFLESL